MLGETALKYYNQGESCSKCIFLACEDMYKIKIDSSIYKMCGGLNNGFGIGEMCSAAVTAVMFIALYFCRDETKIKKARIYFLTSIQDRLKSCSCAKLKSNCGNVIRECGEALEETISEFNGKNR